MTRRAAVARRAAAVLALLLALAAPAAAQSRLGGLAVDRVRIEGGGRVTAWLSVVDGEGGPMRGLDRSSFTFQWDGRTPQDLEVLPVAERDPAFQLTVLLDPDLLRDRGGALRSALESLGGRASESDQIKIGFAAGSDKSVRGPLERAGELLEKLDAGSARADGHLYDALFREVRALARLPRGKAGAVMVVTRGIESGSRHDVPEVLAISRAYAQHVPLLVLVLDPRGAATDADRMARLGQLSGGSYDRLDRSEGLTEAAQRALLKLRGGYVATFKDPRWDGRAERHGLDVAVTVAGEQRTRHAEVTTADSIAGVWWQGPLPLVVLGMVLLLGLLAVPLLWRRPLLKIVVLNGAEKGCSYEVYATPVTIGAAVGNDLSFDEDLLSRNHAVLERRGSGVELVDLNSENGTFVNGDRVSRRRLAKGDRVDLGGAVELEVRG